MNRAILRTVRRAAPKLDEALPSESLGPFSRYLDIPNIILLGDPGSGKTYTFNAAARGEMAVFLPVRHFLAMEGEGCEGNTIYLDGLDEFRSRIGDRNAVFEIIKLLIRLGRPRLRLSCRAADWLGETDLSLFKGYFQESEYVVLSLEPLNEDEITSILIGHGITETQEFIREAKGRGVGGLLVNPQTLIMLAEVVRTGSWPKTKLELYEKAIKILLSEHNRLRMGPGPGQFSPEELIMPAGAACASLLISGVSGISLLENSTSEEFPTYRTIPFADLERIHASLMRRAFSIIDTAHEAVSYIHRTIAEFIAAKWIASQVRSGLPIRRVQGLIGIEGHPAPELRGLHAWLATLLPENASTLIESDPFGVLMYGDPASLSTSDRRFLLYRLEILSMDDPWFRSSDWSDQPLGALSGPDMVEDFQRILSDPRSSFHLRTVVLEAISNGPPLPQTQTILLEILKDSTAPYRERLIALDALLRVIPDGDHKVVEVYRTLEAGKPGNSRLKAEILALSYQRNFNPADVSSLFNEILGDTDEQIVELRGITFSLPEKELPDILDNLCEVIPYKNKDFGEGLRHEIEIVNAFSRMLARVLKSDSPKQPERLWRWLKTLHRMDSHGYAGRKDDIPKWLSENKPMVLDMFKIALDELEPEKRAWTFLHKFQRITSLSLSYVDLANYVLGILRSKGILTEKDCFLYRILGQIVFQSDPPSKDLFEEFFALADIHEELIKIRNELCQEAIPDWQLEQTKTMLAYKDKQQRRRENNLEILKQTKESIRSGRHFQNLSFLAAIYFGESSGHDKKLAPIERLRAEVGEERLIDALEGFSAVISRSDLPSPAEIASITAEGKYSTWWHVILAGMDEAWQKTPALDKFPDNLLKSALAIVIEFPTHEIEDDVTHETVRQWKEQLFKERSDLVQSIVKEMAITCFRAQKNNINVIYRVLFDKQAEPWRGRLALSLLSEFPFTAPGHLRYLTIAAFSDPECHKELSDLAMTAISAPVPKKKEQIAIWLVVGFLLNYEAFKIPLINYAKKRKWVVFILRDIINQARIRNLDKPILLSVGQLETLIKLAGKKYEYVPLPLGESTGHNTPWDATNFIEGLITKLSTIPERGASDALRRLMDNDSLRSYHNHLRHALANQENLRRGIEYIQPSWPRTVEALKGEKPANMADLHAFILEHLETLKKEIRHSNTDQYKVFWRVKGKKAVVVPDIEDNCRDRLIEMLRPRLSPLGIHTEPEGHMVVDKRADIIIQAPGQKLPIELKRDTDDNLWDACVNQLERLYVRDLEAQGYGIFGVFWFGDKRDGNIPAPPAGIELPKSPEDLENALRSLIPSDRRHCLEVVVIDVTPP